MTLPTAGAAGAGHAGTGRARRAPAVTRAAVLGWLREADEGALGELWEQADRVRREHVGDAVHLRGLIEISNFCVRRCGYCGLNAAHTGLARYRMTDAEILSCAREAQRLGYGTVVLQAGEDPGLGRDRVAQLVRQIKAGTGLAVTLSLGERPDADLAAWRRAGADRYLLRFETSNAALFRQIHPPAPGGRDRLEMLRALHGFGYEVGSGVMVGIPGQAWDDLARDLELFDELELDMIGIGPFLPHPATPLGGGSTPAGGAEQVPNDELTTLKMVALARLVRPDSNIPSTTALATIDRERGRELGLERGANVVMPNLTPPAYRALYEIYPGKACIFESSAQCADGLAARIAAVGRVVGTGRGDAPSAARRAGGGS
ncbi:MAG: [FeFe] hydrogenase H-cluster radical SAM maturase HydE [Acidobacteria bacterium]|nr:[FeFe] hydrogenase H-cluster radical SAM maturase HydE [Acidobacteriota bacterium]